MPVASSPAVLPSLATFAAWSPAAADATGIPFAEKIAAQGMLGVAIVLLLMVIVWQERQKLALYAQLKEERDKRLDDNKAATTFALALTEKLHASIDDLAKVAERLERSR